MVTEPLPKTVISCVVYTMHENRFLLFLNHLRLAYSNLKSFALILNIHTARHSFATVLKKSGVNIGIISQALGHQDIKTTQIYLDSFDNEQIDEAMKFLVYLHKKRLPPRTQMADVCLFQVKHLHLL